MKVDGNHPDARRHVGVVKHPEFMFAPGGAELSVVTSPFGDNDVLSPHRSAMLHPARIVVK